MFDRKTVKKGSTIKKRVIQPLFIVVAIIVAFLIGLTINNSLLPETKEAKEESNNYEFNISSSTFSDTKIEEQSNSCIQEQNTSNRQANPTVARQSSVNATGHRPNQQHVTPNSPSTNNASRYTSNQTKPSADYLHLFHSVVKDFHRAEAEWLKVKRDGYVNRNVSDAIEQFARNFKQNIKSLKSDSKNFNLLSNVEKKKIEEMEHFLSDVTRYYHSYPSSSNREK